MNFKTRKFRRWLAGLLLAFGLTMPIQCARAAEDLDFTKLIPTAISKSAIFQQPGWCLWDPCIVDGGDGKFDS